MQERVWRCADGRVLLVSQMSTRHIWNSILRINRMKNWRTEYLDRLNLELSIRDSGLRADPGDWY